MQHVVPMSRIEPYLAYDDDPTYIRRDRLHGNNRISATGASLRGDADRVGYRVTVFAAAAAAESGARHICPTRLILSVRVRPYTGLF